MRRGDAAAGRAARKGWQGALAERTRVARALLVIRARGPQTAQRVGLGAAEKRQTQTGPIGARSFAAALDTRRALQALFLGGLGDRKSVV